MMDTSRLHMLSLVPALTSSLALTACIGAPAGEGETTTAQRSTVVTGNSLSPNGLIDNGLLANGATKNGLLANGLTTTGVKSNAAVMAAIQDPTARQVFSYIVSCALLPTQKVTLTIAGAGSATFNGALGLAPEWGVDSGSCDETCMNHLSPCLHSRVNYAGHRIMLSLRSEDLPVADANERAAYPKREGAYFGNMDYGERWACTEPGSSLINRVCGPPDQHGSCVVDIVGDCNAVCRFVDPDTGFYSLCAGYEGGWEYGSTLTVFRASTDQDNPSGDD